MARERFVAAAPKRQSHRGRARRKVGHVWQFLRRLEAVVLKQIELGKVDAKASAMGAIIPSVPTKTRNDCVQLRGCRRDHDVLAALDRVVPVALFVGWPPERVYRVARCHKHLGLVGRATIARAKRVSPSGQT